MAVAKRCPDCSVVLWGRNEDRVTEIRNGGFPNVTCDLAEAIHESDLVVMAVPVGAMEDLGRQSLQAGLPPGVCVTDVGSVKTHPHASVGRLVTEQGYSFIGSSTRARLERAAVV